MFDRNLDDFGTRNTEAWDDSAEKEFETDGFGDLMADIQSGLGDSVKQKERELEERETALSKRMSNGETSPEIKAEWEELQQEWADFYEARGRVEGGDLDY